MPRPFKCRRITSNPDIVFFKPAGVKIHALEEVSLTLDEYEAIRLADYEGLYQEKAAEKMNISRQTFGNIINSAHKKIADFIINVKALQIKGGNIEVYKEKFWDYKCKNCNTRFRHNIGSFKLKKCPKCNGDEIFPIDSKNRHRFSKQMKNKQV